VLEEVDEKPEQRSGHGRQERRLKRLGKRAEADQSRPEVHQRRRCESGDQARPDATPQAYLPHVPSLYAEGDFGMTEAGRPDGQVLTVTLDRLRMQRLIKWPACLR
jgi:hypothetical protein